MRPGSKVGLVLVAVVFLTACTHLTSGAPAAPNFAPDPGIDAACVCMPGAADSVCAGAPGRSSRL